MTYFEIKAIIEDGEGPVGGHVVYLFSKERKILLPIKVNENSAREILAAREPYHEPRPHIHDTTKRLINALDGKVEKVIISGYDNEIFYSYIRVRHGEKEFDIDAKPSDAIAIALRTKSPIYVEPGVVSQIGINITPELLSEAVSPL